MALTDFLRQSATILVEPTPPPRDRIGGVNRSGAWTVLAESVPCLVRPLSAGVQPQDDARRNVVLYRIYFAFDPVAGGIGTRHRIVVDGQTYAVTGVINPNSLDAIIHVDCEAIIGR